jgi:adenine-specific DNA-methyltransferase
MGMPYEASQDLDDFKSSHATILPEIVRAIKPGGSICWQVGYHVTKQACYPLDYVVFSLLEKFPELHLRNRIIWNFSHGLHRTASFSGRHETVLWFTKGRNYYFDLDAVRVPQKYPGKRHYKGPNKGKLSGNPKGKNPGDVWDIPNVKSNHIEKTEHPCQFPVALAERLIKAMCPEGGLVFDPYAGTASTGVAALFHQRRFLGAEIKNQYVALAQTRLNQTIEGTVAFRPVDRPIYVPNPNAAVARKPPHFWRASNGETS